MSEENEANKEVRKPTGIDPYNEVPEGAMQSDESQIIELTEICDKCGKSYPKEFMCFDYCYDCADKLEED